MQTIITVAVAVVALVAGFFYWQFVAPESYDADVVPIASTTVPQILKIDFAKQISGDGEYIRGVVRFRTPTGNLTHANFEVIEASFFAPFEFDLEVRDTPEGEFEFYISSILPQKVTLRVTLTDDEGNSSAAKEFSFEVRQTGPPGGS